MNKKRKPLELYVHIPFCIRKCAYCDFVSGPGTKAMQKEYEEALLAESDAAEETDSSVSKVVVALNQLIGNKEMYLVLGIFIITTLIVYVVRKLDIEHSWTVAWASGILFEAIGLTAGYILLGISDKIAGVIIGSVISGVIAMIIQFLFFNLDYSRTERLQFEDDDYYYYVKAVPKSLVTEKDKQIKRFNGKNEKERLNKKKFAEEMDIDENLLD